MFSIYIIFRHDILLWLWFAHSILRFKGILYFRLKDFLLILYFKISFVFSGLGHQAEYSIWFICCNKQYDMDDVLFILLDLILLIKICWSVVHLSQRTKYLEFENKWLENLIFYGVRNGSFVSTGRPVSWSKEVCWQAGAGREVLSCCLPGAEDGLSGQWDLCWPLVTTPCCDTGPPRHWPV